MSKEPKKTLKLLKKIGLVKDKHLKVISPLGIVSHARESVHVPVFGLKWKKDRKAIVTPENFHIIQKETYFRAHCHKRFLYADVFITHAKNAVCTRLKLLELGSIL